MGKQPRPVPGVHNSGWVQSPGCANVNDPARWGRLEKYVKEVITTFRDDKRILLWDLYNEPGNPKRGCKSLPLLRKVFEWARTVNPCQPLTSCLEWRTPEEMRHFLLENCDVITFHSYAGPKTLSAKWLGCNPRSASLSGGFEGIDQSPTIGVETFLFASDQVLVKFAPVVIEVDGA